MNKPLCIISCPIDCYSGYSSRSRDFVKSLIKLKGEEWQIQILSMPWGNTPFGYLKEHNETDLISRIIPQLYRQPEIWMQITVPNEFQSIGKYNVGITAGIETTLCDPSWIEGCNRMSLVLVSSNHAKAVFQNKFQLVNPQTNQPQGVLELKTPMEVLFEGVDLNKYKFLEILPKTDLSLELDKIKEDFCFLFVGHWLQGSINEDRKNVGFLIKSFLETFKNIPNSPTLILKTSGATPSIMDRDEILKKIDGIRKTVKGNLPNIYFLHGDMNDEDINLLYNHSKVKAMVNFTKGEGFGRPLLEFTLSKKPLITSGWSGHIDFLNKDFVTLLPGSLNNVHPSAVVDRMILPESQWFHPSPAEVGKAFKDIWQNYKKYLDGAKRQAFKSSSEFSWEKMTEKLDSYINQYFPTFPKPIKLVLPKKIELPKKEIKING